MNKINKIIWAFMQDTALADTVKNSMAALDEVFTE
jgi:hypothetical protein